MKISEITKQGNKILKTIYKYVLISKDKILWKKALESINKHIEKLKQEKNILIIKNDKNVNKTIMELWYWESAKKQFIKKYGKKFL